METNTTSEDTSVQKGMNIDVHVPAYSVEILISPVLKRVEISEQKLMAHRSDIKEVNAAVEELKTDLDDLVSRVDDLPDVGDLKGEVSDLDSKCDDLECKVSDVDNKCDDVDTKCGELEERIETLEGKEQGEFPALEELSETVNTLRSDMDEVRGEIEDAQRTATRLEREFNEADRPSIPHVLSEVNALITRMGGLESRLTECEDVKNNRIKTMQTDIQTLLQYSGEEHERLNSVARNVTNLQEKTGVMGAPHEREAMDKITMKIHTDQAYFTDRFDTLVGRIVKLELNLNVVLVGLRDIITRSY